MDSLIAAAEEHIQISSKDTTPQLTDKRKANTQAPKKPSPKSGKVSTVPPTPITTTTTTTQAVPFDQLKPPSTIVGIVAPPAPHASPAKITALSVTPKEPPPTTTTTTTTTTTSATQAAKSPKKPKKPKGRAPGVKNWGDEDIEIMLDAYEAHIPITENDIVGVHTLMNEGLQKTNRPTRSLEAMKERFRKLCNGAATGQCGYSLRQMRARVVMKKQQVKLNVTILHDAELSSDDSDQDDVALVAVLAASDGVTKKEHKTSAKDALSLLKRSFPKSAASDAPIEDNENLVRKPKKFNVNTSVKELVGVAHGMLAQQKEDSVVRNQFFMKLMEKMQ